MRVMVADAGPLIALSRIGRLSLLADLFESVTVPRAVLEELRLSESRAGVEQLREAFEARQWLCCGWMTANRPRSGCQWS